MDSSDNDLDDFVQMVFDSSRDFGETFTSSSSSEGENENNLDVNLGDFVIAKAHTLQRKGHSKKFCRKNTKRPE